MPKKHDVTVSLGKGNVVHFAPPPGDVTAEFGNNVITLNAAGNLVFTKLEFDDPGPFVWANLGNEIVVIDQNQNPPTNPKKIYKYVVTVKETTGPGAGTEHTSADPLISN